MFHAIASYQQFFELRYPSAGIACFHPANLRPSSKPEKALPSLTLQTLGQAKTALGIITVETFQDFQKLSNASRAASWITECFHELN